jgi:hypothetical protein
MLSSCWEVRIKRCSGGVGKFGDTTDDDSEGSIVSFTVGVLSLASSSSFVGRFVVLLTVSEGEGRDVTGMEEEDNALPVEADEEFTVTEGEVEEEEMKEEEEDKGSKILNKLGISGILYSG